MDLNFILLKSLSCIEYWIFFIDNSCSYSINGITGGLGGSLLCFFAFTVNNTALAAVLNLLEI